MNYSNLWFIFPLLTAWNFCSYFNTRLNLISSRISEAVLTCKPKPKHKIVSPKNNTGQQPKYTLSETSLTWHAFFFLPFRQILQYCQISVFCVNFNFFVLIGKGKKIVSDLKQSTKLLNFWRYCTSNQKNNKILWPFEKYF